MDSTLDFSFQFAVCSTLTLITSITANFLVFKKRFLNLPRVKKRRMSHHITFLTNTRKALKYKILLFIVVPHTYKCVL